MAQRRQQQAGRLGGVWMIIDGEDATRRTGGGHGRHSITERMRTPTPGSCEVDLDEPAPGPRTVCVLAHLDRCESQHARVDLFHL
jgi:hypothetical protein